MRQFDVWWAELKAPIGRRPVVLLTRTSALSYLSRCIVAEVTTIVRGIPQEVPLGPAEGLSRRCVANLDNIGLIESERLLEHIGNMPANRWSEVCAAMAHVIAC